MPTSVMLTARQAPLPWLTWRYSAIFAVAALALLGTLISIARQENPLEITVLDPDGSPIAQASVRVGDEAYLTDATGRVRLERPNAARQVVIERAGYVTMTGGISGTSAAYQQVVLKPAPANSARAPGPTAAPTPTELAAVQAAVSAPATSTPAPRQASHPVSGTIVDAAGQPIAGAWVAAGETFVFTGPDGVFLLDKGVVAPGDRLRVFASGYREREAAAPANGDPLTVRLERRPVKGIYMNPNISTTEADVDRLIDLIDTTELNAIVIDIKEELVFYDTTVQFFRDAGTVTPIIDVPALLAKMQEHNIYTIARLVVFKDGLVAEKHPYLAVLDNKTGGLWRDQNGVAWVNPMMHDLWSVNLELAYEAAMLGFDEIQYDYVRFPTDGDMSRVDYGLENTQEVRERSITKFLEMSHQRLIPTGTKLSADVFGYTVIVDDDLGIGQNFAKLAPHVDYLSPMVYPSHWPMGSLDLPGHPNDFPYETVDISMKAANAKLNGNGLKVRPWLQDFSFPGMKPYGDAEVRAQIDAAEANGVSGWLLWDPNNVYHPGALKPEDGSQTPAASTPQAVIDRPRQIIAVRASDRTA